jgi:hypothetical protein
MLFHPLFVPLAAIPDHHRADGKAQHAAGIRLLVRVLEPLEQVVFVTGLVPAKIVPFHRVGQRGRSGRHVAVTKSVGHHQIGLSPHRHHRLVAPAALEMGPAAWLVALNPGAFTFA